MCVASEADGLPSWLICSAVLGGDEGSARVEVLTAGGAGGVLTAATAEPELLRNECSEEQRSWDSECRARGDIKSVSGAVTPRSFARRDSGIVILALDGARAGL